MRIDKRFFSELFVTKDVNCDPELYLTLYEEIWLCAHYFEEFLNSSESTLKLDCAKKIYSYIQTFNTIIIPEIYVENVISFQQTELIEDSNGYIPQDHVIHSINLYILGIYVFFNSPIFHSQILGNDVTIFNKEEKIKTFINKWRNFSFYHDIGYCFEYFINKDGTIKHNRINVLYENDDMTNNLLYLYSLRGVARLIACVSTYSSRKIEFNYEENKYLEEIGWKSSYGSVIKECEIKNLLLRFNGALKIDKVHNMALFNELFPRFEQEYLVILFDEHGVPIAIGSNSDGNLQLNYSNDLQVKLFDLNSPKIECRYFVKNADESVGLYLNSHSNLVKYFYKDLPETLQHSFKFISTVRQINNYIYSINCWLSSKTDPNILVRKGSPYESVVSKKYNSELTKCIYETVSEIIKDKNINISSKLQIEPVIKQIIKSLNNKDIILAMAKQIQKGAISSYLTENGVSSDILHYFKYIYTSAKKALRKYNDGQLIDDINGCSFFKMCDGKVVGLNLFLNNNDKFGVALYEKIKTLSQELNIDFNELISYEPEHNKVDHGLVAANLFYQATIFCMKLQNYSRTNKELLFSWRNHYCNERDFIDDYAEVIFSILLHNVYSKKSRKENGIKYMQKIDVNPFSYFCAFCDSLQNWGRPKQINFSKANLPLHHFLDDCLDINITNDKIKILCCRDIFDVLRTKLESEKDYLEGVDCIIEISPNI